MTKYLNNSGITHLWSKIKTYVTGYAAPKAHTHPNPLKIFYYGSNSANSNGWYKMCTISNSGYNDVNLNLLITSGYSRQATGLLYVHVRCDNTKANTIQSFKWMYRYGFDASDVYYKDNGDNTFSLFVNQKSTQYGRIQVQILTETGTSNTQKDYNWANNSTKEAAAPTGGKGAGDGATVDNATSAVTANVANVAMNAAGLSTARKLTIGSTGKNFDGTSNVSWSLSEIGAAASSHTHAISSITDLQTTLDNKQAKGEYLKAKYNPRKSIANFESYANEDSCGVIKGDGATFESGLYMYLYIKSPTEHSGKIVLFPTSSTGKIYIADYNIDSKTFTVGKTLG